MTRFVFSLITASIVAVGALQAQQSEALNPERSVASASVVHSDGSSLVNPASSAPSVQEPLQQLPGQPNEHLGGTEFGAESQLAWGFLSMPMPDYLRQEAWGLHPCQGQLVTQVFAASPAARAGVKTGDLLLELDRTPLSASAAFPLPTDAHRVLLLNDAGLQELTLNPLEYGQFPMTAAIQANWPQDLSNLIAGPAMVSPRWIVGTTNLSSPRSLAISELNGNLSVSAVVDTEEGPQQVELRGNRGQIEQQLQTLPGEVQMTLRPHLGL